MWISLFLTLLSFSIQACASGFFLRFLFLDIAIPPHAGLSFFFFPAFHPRSVVELLTVCQFSIVFPPYSGCERTSPFDVSEAMMFFSPHFSLFFSPFRTPVSGV